MTDKTAPWDFSAIAASEPSRAALLASAPSADSLAVSVLACFEDAIRSERVRFGVDESSKDRDDLRLTLQFHIGETLSDQFFNSTTGYRAQFRIDWQRGLNYNRTIIRQLRLAVVTLMPSTFSARCLTHTFDDRGPMTMTRDQACASLDTELSKVWFCGRLILGDGRVQQLRVGITSPRLRLPDGHTWAAIARDDQDAWLDVKGAFVGATGLYQLKDPIERAKRLAATGEA